MNNVSISGSSGFVGKNLLQYLNNKHIGINLIGREMLINIKNTDINGFLGAIVHLAGKAHDLKKVTDPTEYYEVNLEITKKLYDVFLLSKASKFIFVSSVKAVADMVDGVLTEDNQPNPQTYYGKSKLLAEQYIQNQPLPKGKTYYILRPCMIHGPGNKGNLNLLYNFIKKDIPYPLAGFNNKRSFLSVQNLCFIINELIERDDIESGVYNVSDDETLSTNEVITILAESLQIKPRLWHISPQIIKYIATVGDWLHLPITTERLNKLTENYIVKNTKLKKALNKNLPFTVIEGLKITANSFKAHHLLQ